MLALAFPHTITYWAPGDMDGYGQRTFDDPIVIRGRWEDRTDLTIVTDAETKPSKAVVYSAQAVVIGGYLAKGSYTSTDDPRTLNVANIIKAYLETPSVDGRQVLRKVLM